MVLAIGGCLEWGWSWFEKVFDNEHRERGNYIAGEEIGYGGDLERDWWEFLKLVNCEEQIKKNEAAVIRSKIISANQNAGFFRSFI